MSGLEGIKPLQRLGKALSKKQEGFSIEERFTKQNKSPFE
jgi:hypothetical protein